MSQSKPNYKPNHSSSSDDDEEEEVSGSEDEQTSGSDSDTDSDPKPKPDPKKTLTGVTAPPQSTNKPPDLSSESESESESGSGSGSETDSDSDLPPKLVIKKDGKQPPDVKQNKVNGGGYSYKVINNSKAKASNLSVSETEESGSETDKTDTDNTDTGSHPKKAGQNIKNVELKLAEKTGDKTVATPPRANIKRPADAQVEKEAKKSKQNKVNGGGDLKKGVVSCSQAVEKPKPRDSSVSGSETDESGSETDTDTDTDTGSQPKKAAKADVNINNNVKPISSKPMELKTKSKSVEKTGYKTESTPTKAVVDEKDLKGGKRNGGGDEETKKQLFQRLWSEDDEIAILEGMIGYKNENGERAMADMGAFHEFIKKKLHVEVSRAQLVDKVRRLKKKYVNNVSRERDGKDRSFSKSHEQKGYELSKLIWGSNSNSNSNNKSQIGEAESKKKNQSQKNGKLKGTVASTSTGTGTSTGAGASLVTSNGVDDKDKVMMEVEKNMDISRFVNYGGMIGSPIVSEEIVKAGLELVEGSKRAELEAKWRKLKEQELEIYVKRMELLREQALVVLEAVRSSGN